MKAVLFDNDGILADTESLYYEACRAALRERGLELSVAEYQDVSLRQGASTIDFAARGTLPAAELAVLKRRRDALYLESLSRGVPPRAGALELLDALSGRLSLAVVTAAHREHFEAMHRPSGLARRFDFVLTQEDCPVSKPRPDPYLMALDRGGWKASDCVVIEDTERGLAAARAAGIACYVVPCGPSVGGRFEGALEVLPGLAALKQRLLARL